MRNVIKTINISSIIPQVFQICVFSGSFIYLIISSFHLSTSQMVQLAVPSITSTENQ